MKTATTHYTNFGVAMPPLCADFLGYIEYREGFDTLPESEWTEGEKWIYQQEKRISEWQRK